MQSKPAPQPTGWRPFDYGDPPEGVCWLEVERPETDGDVDDTGRVVGWFTGETRRLVVLAEVFREEHGPEFEPVAWAGNGDVEDHDTVRRFMPLTPPELPA